MTNATAKIDLNITEGMIANAISIAIAESFSPDKKDQVIRDIVRAHLAYKQNSYDRDTMLSAAIGTQIRQLATEAVKQKVASMADDVNAAVDKALGPQFRSSVIAQLEASLARLTVANIQIDARVVVD
jgi:hypothetical protein